MTKKFIVQWGHIHGKLPDFSGSIDPHGSQTWVPNTDVCEGPEGILVRMELAGITLDNLEIYVEEQVLVVRGVREDPAAEESAAGYRFRQLEIEYGPFQRVLPLPYPVDGDNTKAHMRNGVLEVKLPRAESLRHRTIAVIVER